MIDDWPPAEPIPSFANDIEREGARRAVTWLLDDIGREGIAIKVIALRYVFRREPRPMAVLAKKYRVTKAAISKQATALANSLGFPALASPTARESYSRGQRRSWRSGRRKKKCGSSSNGAVATNDGIGI